MTDDLVAFLRARYDEEEQRAHAVQDGSAPWVGQWVNDNGRALRTVNGHVLAYLPDARPFKPGVLDHIARHDPARVLREVEAKRLLLELHARHDWLDGCATCDLASESCGCVSGPSISYPCDTVKLLALPYADQPDYRAEWRPIVGD